MNDFKEIQLLYLLIGKRLTTNEYEYTYVYVCNIGFRYTNAFTYKITYTNIDWLLRKAVGIL